MATYTHRFAAARAAREYELFGPRTPSAIDKRRAAARREIENRRIAKEARQ